MTKTQREERIQTVKYLKEQGVKNKDIAKQLNVSTKAIEKMVTKYKLSSTKSKDESIKKVLEMKMKGFKIDEISKEMNLSIRTIKNKSKTNIEYVDIRSGQVVKSDVIYKKEEQLFNYLRFNIYNFNHIIFRNMFLEERFFHRSTVYSKRTQTYLFSEKFLVEFENRISDYYGGSVFRIKSNGILSGKGFYGSDKWKNSHLNIAQFVHGYSLAENKYKFVEDFLSKFSNGIGFYFYLCGYEIYNYISMFKCKINMNSYEDLCGDILGLPDIIYYNNKSFNKLSLKEKEYIVKQVKDEKAICNNLVFELEFDI